MKKFLGYRTWNNLVMLLLLMLSQRTVAQTLSTGEVSVDGNNDRPVAVVSDGGPVEHINNYGFLATTLYDIDNDGNMELIGLTANSLVYVKNGEEIDKDAVVGYSFGNISNRALWVGQQPNSEHLQFGITNGEKFLLRQTENKQCEGIIDGDYSLYVDVDNDGLKDIVGKNGDEFYIYMQQPDGTFVKSKQHLTANVEETASSGNQSIVNFLQGFLRNGMFVDDAPSPLENLTKAVDFNNDGILDLIDDVTGGIMYSYADGKYYTSKSKEIVYPIDIDNDGALDYVVFDGETLYLMANVQSAQSEKKELYKNSKIDKVFFRDFDHDGDIDILAFFNTGNNDSVGVSYFVFLRNNGDGSFRRKESNMSETLYSLVDCRDVDADGLYELIVCDNSYDMTSYEYKKGHIIFKVNGDFTISETPVTLGVVANKNYNYARNLQLGDFDNDGYTEYYFCDGDVYGHYASQTVQNTAPAKMNKPSAVYDAETNRLRITWSRGTDMETSACDLTYALRIGTAPGKDDIVRPASLPDGRRKTIREGEMGHALQCCQVEGRHILYFRTGY